MKKLYDIKLAVFIFADSTEEATHKAVNFLKGHGLQHCVDHYDDVEPQGESEVRFEVLLTEEFTSRSGLLPSERH